MAERKYNYTFADLLDRLSIAQLKCIFIFNHKETYLKEVKDIKHDIDLIIKEKNIKLSSKIVHAIMILMLSNRYIWENESKIREEGNDKQQEKLLRLTHSINGIRNNAKNIINGTVGERIDLKVDCLAADLIEEFGNWLIDYT